MLSSFEVYEKVGDFVSLYSFMHRQSWKLITSDDLDSTKILNPDLDMVVITKGVLLSNPW